MSASTSSGTPVSVRGTTSGRTYEATLYATSSVSDCASHSYGAKMISFFRAHPCNGATRRLSTLDLGGRTVALSSVSLSMPPGPSDVYQYTAQFVRIENSNCDCGVNDLLREGYTIPQGPSRIPAHEAFQVVGQDNGVTVFDAWYLSGPTTDQDPALMRLERDLFLTPLG